MMLPTAAVVVPNDAADVTYHVECGECPNDLGTPRTARFAVVYETVTVDGEPGVERLFSCSPCLGAVVGWANDHHDGFTPPTISKLPELAGPRCPWCHAPYVGCVTNFRGICIKSPVAAR